MVASVINYPYTTNDDDILDSQCEYIEIPLENTGDEDDRPHTESVEIKKIGDIINI